MRPANQTVCALALFAAVLLAATAGAQPVAPGDPDYLWLFDEGVGATVADTGAADAGKTAVFNGSPTWSTQTPFTYAGNNSLAANGAGAARVSGFNVNMGTQTTISMWVRRTGTTGLSRYAHDTSGGTGRALWYYNGDGGPKGDAVYWNSQNLTPSGLSTLLQNEWTHLALVRDGTTVRMYDKGVLRDTETVAGTATTFGDLFLGSRFTSNEFFNGEIDEYAYWTSALTSDNIEWLSQNSLGSPGSGPPPPTNLALGGTYSWSRVPGQPPQQAPTHYQDDYTGLHAVHTAGVGVFDSGDLNDGVIHTTQGSRNSPVVGQWQALGTDPDINGADIIFDLGQLAQVENIILGTWVSAGANNNAPDDVSVSFSSDNVTYGPTTFYDLEAVFGPLGNGHHDLDLDLVGSGVADTLAQFVKLSFDGGSMAEPGGSDPDEKWMLDEVRIIGSANFIIPEPSTLIVWSLLAGLGISVGWRRRKRG